jgi:hypothetical protein
MVSSEGEAARPTSQTSRVSEYPASCLPACPTLGAAYGQRMAHVPSLPPTVARVLGRPLVGGGMALAVWFVRTMR